MRLTVAPVSTTQFTAVPFTTNGRERPFRVTSQLTVEPRRSTFMPWPNAMGMKTRFTAATAIQNDVRRVRLSLSIIRDLPRRTGTVRKFRLADSVALNREKGHASAGESGA